MVDPSRVVKTEFAGLELIARGKVRDLYDLGEHLLLVATDRLSAFDWVLPHPIPNKGRILNQISVYWFEMLSDLVPNHLVTADVEDMPALLRPHHDVLRGRAMLCKKAETFPVECIVRAFLVGSGYKDYLATQQLCGHPLPLGLNKGARLTEPLFTPSTKADVGDHDINIDEAAFMALCGSEHGSALKSLSLEAFKRASAHAQGRGITLCDTKLEWGMIDGEPALIDEIFTPDSSRFWKTSEKDATPAGEDPPSFDKQVVRDWLETTDWDKASPPPALPEEILELASQRYLEIFETLTGKSPELPGG